MANTRKSTAKKSATKKTTPQKAATKKSAAKKSAANKSAGGPRKSTAKEGAAKKSTPAASSSSAKKSSSTATRSSTAAPRTESARKPDRSGGKSSAVKMARAAAEQLMGLTGREAEGVTAIERTDDGWQVSIEVLESRRIPDSTDILAIYEVDLDESGELMGYHRVRRYTRGRTGDDGRDRR